MSDVYFVDFRKAKKSVLLYIDKALELLYGTKIKPNDIVAIKMHFGELGNTTFIRPLFIRRIVEFLIRNKAKPFLTDTTTLYHGERQNAVDYLNAAVYNGFGYDSVGCPIIIADGIQSNNVIKCETPDSRFFKHIKYGGEFAQTDKILIVSHVKGHMLSGFGGAIKNIAMGMANRATKQQMHGDVKPSIKLDKCTGCGTCIRYCPVDAVRLVNRKAVFDLNVCIGCADCITVCPENALKILWNEKPQNFLDKMGEVAYFILKDIGKYKERQPLYINFIMDITPDCDCMDSSLYPIAPDVGILFSYDPVAIDQASCDLVAATSNSETGKTDAFTKLRPNLDFQHLMNFCEKKGIGTRDYAIKEL